MGLHTATPASYPLERVFTDFMGHLVCTKKGNQAILVVIDSFSKFVAFYPVHNITSTTVCNVLGSRYFTAYGVPKSIVSDNAKVFRSKAFYDFCFPWGIKRINTTPYYPQGSLAERANRNLKAALKIFHHHGNGMRICTCWHLPSIRLTMKVSNFVMQGFSWDRVSHAP